MLWSKKEKYGLTRDEARSIEFYLHGMSEVGESRQFQRNFDVLQSYV